MQALADYLVTLDDNLQRLDAERVRVLDRAFADACRDVGIEPRASYADTSRARKIRQVIAVAVAEAASDGECSAGMLKWVAFRKCQASFRS